MIDRPAHPAQSTGDPHPGWPPGVRPISQDGLDYLGVGGDGTIYWQGKPIEVRKRVALTRWQTIGAIATAVGAAIGGIGAFAPAIHDWFG